MSAAQLQALPHAPLPWPQMRMTCQSACSCGRRASTALAVASCRAVQPGGSLNSACISPAASIRSSRCAWHHCQPLRSRASPARLATTADGSSHAATAQHTAAPLPADCCGTAGRPHQPHSRLSRLSQSEAGQASRRTLLTGLAAAQLAALQHPQAVAAAVVEARNGVLIPPQPRLLDVFTGGGDRLPPAVRFPRRKLAQRFAVLLMQSCYRAADALDFIPMDEFQVRFWKLRQGAYADYLQAHSGLQIRQGNLADPLYFDFISFAQFATVSEAMEIGRREFEEFCEDCDTLYRTVRRDPELVDNRLLPGAFQAAAGDRIYAALRSGFPRADGELEQFGGPQPAVAGASLAELAAGAAAIADIFVLLGFANKGGVKEVRPDGGGSGGSFTVRLDAPANLWGSAALAARRCSVVNAYDAFAVGGWLRASGIQGASYTFTRTDAATETRWTLK